MCGRFFVQMSWSEYLEHISLIPTEAARRPLAARSNICPTQEVAVLDADLSVRGARWGLVPHWMGEIPTKPMINARGETVLEKPMFRDAFKGLSGGRRGFVIADGYYEWANDDGRKVPFKITLRDRAPFLFAAIIAHHPKYQADSVAILTLEANAAIANVHHRMPVILNKKVERDWLDPSVSPDHAQAMLFENRGSELVAAPCAFPT